MAVVHEMDPFRWCTVFFPCFFMMCASPWTRIFAMQYSFCWGKYPALSEKEERLAARPLKQIYDKLCTTESIHDRKDCLKKTFNLRQSHFKSFARPFSLLGFERKQSRGLSRDVRQHNRKPWVGRYCTVPCWIVWRMWIGDPTAVWNHMLRAQGEELQIVKHVPVKDAVLVHLMPLGKDSAKGCCFSCKGSARRGTLIVGEMKSSLGLSIHSLLVFQGFLLTLTGGFSLQSFWCVPCFSCSKQ